MVLTDDNFATIIKAVESGRNIYENIKKAIQFLLSGNFAAILVVIVASLMSLPVPFAPVHLLFINLLTDSLPAIALGLEPYHHDVMGEKAQTRKGIHSYKRFPDPHWSGRWCDRCCGAGCIFDWISGWK